MSCIMSERLEALSRRLVEDENNYGRALAALEDRIRDLERASVGERVALLEERRKSRKGDGLRDVAVVYRCNACDPGDGLPPCVCMLSHNLGVPTGCIYGTRRASDVPAAWVVVDQDLGAIILDGIFAGVHE